MGLDLTVTFSGSPPAWAAVRDRLVSRGVSVQMRMIDGQLAFPDEEPPEPWHELRVAAGGGMVTLRRGPDRVTCVVFGNADDATRRLWNDLALAFAEADKLFEGRRESQPGT
jgi:hypothetical protein